LENRFTIIPPLAFKGAQAELGQKERATLDSDQRIQRVKTVVDRIGWTDGEPD